MASLAGVVPLCGDDAGLGGESEAVAEPRGAGVASLLPPRAEGDRVAAGPGGEPSGVAELVRPPGEFEVGCTGRSGRVPGGGHEPADVRGDVPVVEVADGADADRDAADLLGALDRALGYVGGDLLIGQLTADVSAHDPRVCLAAPGQGERAAAAVGVRQVDWGDRDRCEHGPAEQAGGGPCRCRVRGS
jgi:hypothetical protein